MGYILIYIQLIKSREYAVKLKFLIKDYFAIYYNSYPDVGVVCWVDNEIGVSYTSGVKIVVEVRKTNDWNLYSGPKCFLSI